MAKQPQSTLVGNYNGREKNCWSMQKVCLVPSKVTELESDVTSHCPCLGNVLSEVAVWFICVCTCVCVHHITCVHASRASEVKGHPPHSPASIGQRPFAFVATWHRHGSCVDYSATSGFSMALYRSVVFIPVLVCSPGLDGVQWTIIHRAGTDAFERCFTELIQANTDHPRFNTFQILSGSLAKMWCNIFKYVFILCAIETYFNDTTNCLLVNLQPCTLSGSCPFFYLEKKVLHSVFFVFCVLLLYYTCPRDLTWTWPISVIHDKSEVHKLYWHELKWTKKTTIRPENCQWLES